MQRYATETSSTLEVKAQAENLSLYTVADLRGIEHRLNNRPRKTLSWQTLAQAFAAALAS